MLDTRIIALVLALAIGPAGADEVQLRPDHPDRYTVVKGDTLWDISARFLTDPWLWPEVWGINPEIKNPHLIYPGDTIRLVWVDGQPQLQVDRSDTVESQESTAPPMKTTVKLSPRARPITIDNAIPTIPIDAIQQLLSDNRLVLDPLAFEQAPYVVDSVGRHLIAGTGHTLYVRSIANADVTRFGIYRKGQAFIDPRTDGVLGYEAVYLGDAELLSAGDPARLKVREAQREILLGDRLFPYTENRLRQNFRPRAPFELMNGSIIAVVGGVSLIAQHQSVALNLGRRHGLKEGHVLEVFQSGGVIRDTVQGDDEVRLPDERSGILMVVKVYNQMSYGLIMSADVPIQVGDIVRTP